MSTIFYLTVNLEAKVFNYCWNSDKKSISHLIVRYRCHLINAQLWHLVYKYCSLIYNFLSTVSFNITEVLTVLFATLFVATWSMAMISTLKTPPFSPSGKASTLFLSTGAGAACCYNLQSISYSSINLYPLICFYSTFHFFVLSGIFHIPNKMIRASPGVVHCDV